MWLLFAAQAIADPDAAAAALTACLQAEPTLVTDLGAGSLRAVHVGLFAPRTFVLLTDRATTTLDQRRCAALAALPDIPDGALRCVPLPKGGFSCKPVLGPAAAEAHVARAIEEKRPALAACTGGKGTWTLTFPVLPDGTPGEVELHVVGPLDGTVVSCLVQEVSAWRFGPIFQALPTTVVVPAG